jgi:peroxiredoxin
VLRAALLLISAALAGAPVVPPRLVDVDGNALEIRSLARSGRLFLVTLKSATCPVCAQQLVRLEQQRAQLETCGARFVVLAPGPAREIHSVRRTSGFAAPFVEDADLRLAGELGLRLGADQITPAILEVDEEGRIVWQQRGRSEGSYGDAALRRRLGCESHET